MRVWTVHAREVPPASRGQGPAEPGASNPWAPPAAVPASPPRPASGDPVALVPEGFSWAAFFLSVIWLLWHRLWLVALLFAVLSFALGALLPVALAGPVQLALAVLLGAHAHDLRRGALARKGLQEVGVVAARDQDAALARLLAERPDLAAPLSRAALA